MRFCIGIAVNALIRECGRGFKEVDSAGLFGTGNAIVLSPERFNFFTDFGDQRISLVVLLGFLYADEGFAEF